ncbi:MAG: protein kinase [Planctomycetes bacterium]|nr:protein kinase [Planctomycetota bacterium]
MKSRLDMEFGNLAVSEGFTTPEQVQISQRIVDAFEAEDPRKSIDVILLDRGYITHEQWIYLLEKLGITVILCPHCNKRFKEDNVDIGKVIACKHCGKTFEYKVSSESHAHQTSSICDNTLSPLEPPTYDHYIGKLLGGKYKIIEKIATGGWSTIYKAKRTLLDIDDIVAVKILHLNLSDNPQDIKRFYNEAAIIRELRHPNAIHLYDFDRDSNGTIYMAMEFIYGKNLKETIKDTGPFDVARMLNIIYQVCDVISTAHKHPKKIIHRDITPQNIMLTKVGETNDFVKVLDFGIVKLRTHDNVSLTGSIVGTPPYMAPEQWRGECDERTDIYSLGIIMYEMLTGESPFKGDQITLMNKHLNERPQPFRKRSRNSGISKRIENIVFKCLEKNKHKRPSSIDELKLLLQEAEVSAPKKFTIYAKAGILAAILVILTIPAMVYIFFLSNKSEITQLPVVAVKSKSNHSTKIMNDSDRKSNKQERQSQTIKQDIAENLPGDNTEKKTADDNKYYNKVVANIQKYDINKETKNIVLKPDPREVLKNEIQTWLQTYKNAWEKGDIETLKKLGHITSEEEEDKLRNHYMYVRDIKVSIQNEVIEINDDNRQTTVSFDRTDEWTDERGERHKESLPRIVKTLRKENNIWKIAK